jgi:tripartite-type tricarboxylate transporter receptor subunit TctC
MRILRAAFTKVMSDPDIMVDAHKKGLEPSPVSGDELEGLVKELVQPPEVIQRVKTFLQN